MPGYSKGSRGLSVFPRVLGIFTETTISPSLWSRQRPDRYAFRAGRNLPDKEFRLSPCLQLVTLRTTNTVNERHSLDAAPACRHADGTISSSDVSDVWRMVSEDSDQLVSGFLAVHRLGDLCDLDQPWSGQMRAAFDQLHTTCELFKVLLL